MALRWEAPRNPRRNTPARAAQRPADEAAPCPGCGNYRAPEHALCRRCWDAVPLQLRDSFYATRPHSNARRAALLAIYREVVRWTR